MRMKIRLHFVLCVVLIVFSQCTRLERHDEVILRNGLRVVLFYKDSPITSAVFCIRSGIQDGFPGIAQVTAQMLLQGTDVRTAHQTFKELEFLGGTIGYRTTLSTSYVFVQSPETTFDKCFQLLCECISEPSFDRESVSQIPVGNEPQFSGFPSKPSYYNDEHIRRMLFHESQLNRPFFMKDFSASREDILKYYQEKFTPRNMVLVISGRFNSRRTLLKAAALWKMNHSEGVSPEVENSLGNLADPPEQIRPGKDGNDYVCVGFRAPAFLQEYYFETRLLEKLLTPGSSSDGIPSESNSERIDRDISCSYHAESNCGYLIVSVKTSPGNGLQKKEEILRRLTELKTTGIPWESFSIAKRKLLLDERILSQYTLYDAVLLGTMILSRFSPLSLYEFENRITGVTLESAQGAAKNLFKDPVVWISQSSHTQ